MCGRCWDRFRLRHWFRDRDWLRNRAGRRLWGGSRFRFGRWGDPPKLANELVEGVVPVPDLFFHLIGLPYSDGLIAKSYQKSSHENLNTKIDR